MTINILHKLRLSAVDSFPTLSHEKTIVLFGELVVNLFAFKLFDSYENVNIFEKI